jgi:hypothetical protein
MQVQSCYCYVFKDYINFIIIVNDRFWFKASSEQFNQSLDRPTVVLCKVAFTDDERLIGEAAKNQVRNGSRSENLRWESREEHVENLLPVKPLTSGACKIGSIPDSSHGHGDRGAMVFICFHGVHIFSWPA